MAMTVMPFGARDAKERNPSGPMGSPASGLVLVAKTEPMLQ